MFRLSIKYLRMLLNINKFINITEVFNRTNLVNNKLNSIIEHILEVLPKFIILF